MAVWQSLCGTKSSSRLLLLCVAMKYSGEVRHCPPYTPWSLSSPDPAGHIMESAWQLSVDLSPWVSSFRSLCSF